MGWVLFTGHYDHRWPSGAVTEYAEGMKVHVKKEIEDEAIGLKVAEAIKKPAHDDPAVVKPPRRSQEGGLSLGERRTPREITVGGHRLPISSNPETLPDASDPDAVRGEPLVEVDRARAVGLPEAAVEDAESESQVDAAQE